MKFIEGQGWLVDEAQRPPAAGAAVVVGNARKGAAEPAGLTHIESATLEAELSRRGLVVISADDHESFLATKEDFEHLKADHEALKAQMATKAATGNGKKGAKQEPAPEHTMEEMEALIAAATTLDELTALMKDEERRPLLTLAEARANEIQGAA